MSRIFASLSLVAILLVAIVLALGLNIGSYNEVCLKIASALRASSDSPRDGLVTFSVDGTEQRVPLEQLRNQLRPYQDRTVNHKLVAILSALVTVLVNCISITYFIGTNRWCKEVVGAYQLGPELIRRSNQIKRRSFPWSFAGILVILVVIALGAACDPATQRGDTFRWVQPHLWGAFVGISFIMISFAKQWSYIAAHSALVESVLDQVKTIRKERGLAVDE